MSYGDPWPWPWGWGEWPPITPADRWPWPVLEPTVTTTMTGPLAVDQLDALTKRVEALEKALKSKRKRKAKR